MSYLTAVTLEMEVLVECHHSDRFLAARGRNNGLIAAHAQRGETPAREGRRGHGLLTAVKWSHIQYSDETQWNWLLMGLSSKL